jgi:hypothetical protein
VRPSPRTTPRTAAPPSESGLYGEDLRLEKQATLQDLERLREAGAQLSKQYVLSDNLEDMRFELQKHATAADERQSVGMMKAGLEAVIKGAEFGNRRFGPFLAIDGWADQVTEDMTKFNDPLARIYRKYWRRSRMSPEMELASVIFGSMGWYHMQNVWNGPSETKAAVAPPAAPIPEGMPPTAPTSQPSPIPAAQRTMPPPTFDD